MNFKRESVRLIEYRLPLEEINFHSAVEMAFRMTRGKLMRRFKDIYGHLPQVKGGGTPQIQNLHLWLARRPCSASRVLSAAALLPAFIDLDTFRKIVGLDSVPELSHEKILPILINTSPSKDNFEYVLEVAPESKVIIDPMAGGGSIPLESLRLGLKTIAMDYNPVAYIILKATLEFPAKYGKQLYEDVKKEAISLIEWAKENLSEYYPKDVLNYIYARGVRCPNCNGIIPLINSPRLKKGGPYIQLIFDREKKRLKSVKIVGGEPEFVKLRCPYCRSTWKSGEPIDKDDALRSWVKCHKQLIDLALSGDVDKTRESAERILEVNIPLVKQTSNGFTNCDNEDHNKLIESYIELARRSRELKEYLPMVEIPKENEVFAPVRKYGITSWYQLFNPRQLLVMGELIKYVRLRANKLISEMGEYGSAIVTYLAFGLSKLADYNNISAAWHSSRGVIRHLDGQYASKKSVGLGLDYTELIAPLEKKSLGWIYEPMVDIPTATRGGICPVLKLLCEWINGLDDRIEIYMADARELSRIAGKNIVDVINVDPPYHSQHKYSDLSEYFWQILRLVLLPVIREGYLFNRDPKKGRVECRVSGWNPLLIPTVPRAGEIIVRKVERGKSRKRRRRISLERSEKEPHTEGWYQLQMYNFFVEAKKTLRDDGLLITWYTHSDPKVWESVMSSIYAAEFVVTKIWTIWTEAARFIGRLGGSSFFTSLAIICRKADPDLRVIVGETRPEQLREDEKVRKAVVSAVDDAIESAIASGASPKETFVMGLAGAIAGITRVWNPNIEVESPHKSGEESEDMESDLEINTEGIERYLGGKIKHTVLRGDKYHRLTRFFSNSLYPTALFLGVQRMLERDVKEAGLEKYLRMISQADDHSKAYLLLRLSTKFAERPVTDYDFAEKVCKMSGVNLSSMQTLSLVIKKERNNYLIPFGHEFINRIEGKEQLAYKTDIGQAMLLILEILNSPESVRSDARRCARHVYGRIPVIRRVAAIALFLIKTAKEEELKNFGIESTNKPFIEKVLELIAEGEV